MNRKICIVGGGPAGLSCALWVKYLGLSPIILEKHSRLGGLQHTNSFQNTWYMGIPGKNGQAFIQDFIRHAEAETLPTLLNASPQKITQSGDDFHITVGRTEILAKALVICTGQHIRRYDHVQEIAGSEVLKDSPQVCFNPGSTPLQVPYVAGQHVAIIGGGDNGLATAALMASTADHIHLIVRSEIRGFGLYKQWVMDGIQSGKITLHQPAHIQRFETKGDQIGITLWNGDRNPVTLPVDFICFRLGLSPNVKAIDTSLQNSGIGRLALTPSGYIKTDEFCRTSIPRIYAAGDVANQRDPCVATAVAQGTIAARSLEADLRSRCWRFS
ncbi:MAG: NAD(P)/FAD-dependent oxidoreductase [Leptolyngbya sp. SIO1E4]|nr:NAD(P)/FAD-dependent oxidoreductase [Leptolyngbya sp. SIO1E4]